MTSNNIRFFLAVGFVAFLGFFATQTWLHHFNLGAAGKSEVAVAKKPLTREQMARLVAETAARTAAHTAQTVLKNRALNNQVVVSGTAAPSAGLNQTASNR